MIVREAQNSKVLVQTRGNIVLRVERDPARFASKLHLAKLRNGLASGAFVVGLVGIIFAVQAPNSDPVQSELRLTSRIQNVEHLLNGLAQASATQAATQAARSDTLQQTASKIDQGLVDLPNTFDASVQRSTRSVVGAISELQLKPTFPMVYSDAPTGFESAPKPEPAAIAAAKPASVRPAPVRRRVAVSPPSRVARRQTSNQGTSAPVEPPDMP